MKRALLIALAAALSACAPGEPGPDAPLQLTHNAITRFEMPTPATQAGRDVVAQCYNSAVATNFELTTANHHYSAIAVGLFPSGGCYWAYFQSLPNAQAAQSTVLGVCQNEGISHCTVAAIGVPDMNIPLGARTAGATISQWIADNYLTSSGYAALAATPNGYYGIGLDAPSQEAADRHAMTACAEDAAEGFGWNEGDPDRATRIFQQEQEICQIVNRRSPDGTMTPRVLPH